MYNYLGNTGVKLSQLGLGTMTFGGVGRWSDKGSVDLHLAKRFLDICLERGINLLDTADIYSNGAAEEIVGNCIEERRNDVFLATKLRGRMGTGVNQVGLSRLHIMEACNQSLKRLNTDHIDLYQIHVFDPCTPLEETLRAMDDLVRQGKVRYIGCSNYAAWQLMKALGISECQKLEKFVSIQAHYSLLNRDIEEEIVPAIQDQNVGLIVWSPLEGGFLTGKYKKGKKRPEGVRLCSSNREILKFSEEKAYVILDVLAEIAEERNVSTAQAALNYLCQKQYVTSVLIGARTEEQLQDNLGALDWKLSEKELSSLDEVSMPVKHYPKWLQMMTNQDRL